MKRILFLMMAVAAISLLGGCKVDTTCRIHGTVGMERLNGKKIFLVPLYGPKSAEYVDSVVIKDGKFEFTPDSAKMYKIILDYHFRDGVQTLLVVGEPGDVQVKIDSVSSTGGTPQNDSLQAWKDMTEQHNREFGMVNRTIYLLKQKGDTVQAAQIQNQANAVHLAYKKRSRQMAANMEGTALSDFLGRLFPLTYERKMLDGTVVTMDADTNEPISK